MTIPFNKPYLHGRELVYIAEAVASGKISGDGLFTRRCHDWFEARYGMRRALLTTSCTDALEMAALLLDISPGDEVIVPSYTFVSSANAFCLRGAGIRFADSNPDEPNVSPAAIEELITDRTRAIVVVHYAGVACDMDAIMALADRHGIPVVEDAAQGIESFYRGRQLGTIGTFGTFSFHETKNVIAGEGGLLSINAPSFIERAEIIREKGTNRSAFFRGEVDKYGWVDLGSSFLPSDVIAAYLYAQLEVLKTIQEKRLALWSRYDRHFRGRLDAAGIGLPLIPDYATNNAHMYYIVLPDAEQRASLIEALAQQEVKAVFHYISLHSSPYFLRQHDNRPLPNSDRFTEGLLRLPMYYELTLEAVDRIAETVLAQVEAAGRVGSA